MELISNCTADAISNAAKALKEGHLVAFPTETVYGLGADATNEQAVSRIYSVKGRPTDHPLIVHISSINKLEDWATDIPDYAIKLAKEFWPGPMTLILPRKDIAKDFITGGQDSVGLRVPDQPVALTLLKEFEELGGQGVAAPSANRFGAVSPTTAEAVGEELGEYLDSTDLVLDGGQSLIGIESTIIDCTGVSPRVLRPGAVSRSNLRNREISTSVEGNFNKKIKTSGDFDSHYSPRTKVSLNEIAQKGEGLLALAEFETPIGVIRLGSPKTIEDFAHVLYDVFRMADKLKLNKLNVHIESDHPLTEALLDRIKKASNLKI